MIVFLDENFSELNDFILNLQPSKLLILVDENTHEHCLPVLMGNLATEILFEIIEIEPGEEMKSLETASQLWEILTEFETDRKSLMINLGGGVITDLGGFVASTYKRGIPFINMPTTLLGMCDASLGGKTGIDHQFLKNIIGTFANPVNIFVFSGFLQTLPLEELRSGFAEMLKHGLIADESHWEELTAISSLEATSVLPFIRRSMEIKHDIVTEDFREENIRKNLNFGHTVGHAVESKFLQAGQPILHGEAVAMGMICETRISYLLGMISEKTANEIILSLRKFFPFIEITDFPPEEFISLMKNDKKNLRGTINFTLLSGIGTAEFECGSPDNLIIEALQYYQNIR